MEFYKWDIDFWIRSEVKLHRDPVTDRLFSSTFLLKMMQDRGILPSLSDMAIRQQILMCLKQTVSCWIEALSNDEGMKLNAELVPYGSFGLQVYNGRSDVDILVIAPSSISMDLDFFGHLHGLVEAIPGVRNLKGVKSAKVPLLKFNLHGVDVDVACARLSTVIIPRPEILHQQNFCISSALATQDKLTLESVKCNWTIFQCLGQNRQNFVHATLFLKAWADIRSIYGNINCYIGGVHLAVMVAYICMNCYATSCAGVISAFFATFSVWSWKTPVVLHGECSDAPTIYMPIQKPGTDGLCQSNVTKGTLERIRGELQRGHMLTQVFSSDWRYLLSPYEVAYRRFIKVKIYVTEDGEDAEIHEWMGFIKSRIPVLVRSLEANGIRCDPSVVEFRETPPSCRMDNKSDNRLFLWGIIDDTGNRYDLSGPESTWKNNLKINCGGLQGHVKLAIITRRIYEEYRREASRAHNL